MADMTRHARVLRRAVVAMALFPFQGAFAFDLPAGLPVRNDGLWEIDQTSTISGGGPTIEMQKTWNACLDGKTDRAFHELDVREDQARAARFKARCDAPNYSLAGNVLSSTMQCTGPLPTNGKVARWRITRSTMFVSGEESRAQATSVRVNDDASQGHGRSVTRMKLIGNCTSDMKPGRRILLHWKVNGEETLKARQITSVRREIREQEALTASRLK